MRFVVKKKPRINEALYNFFFTKYQIQSLGAEG
jgi:hypothetical protein